VLVCGPGYEVGELKPWVALGPEGELWVLDDAAAVGGEGLVGGSVGSVGAGAVGEHQAEVRL
jgi:hypothetical protein